MGDDQLRMSRAINFRYGFLLLSTIGLFSASAWVKNRGPFERIAFSLRTGSAEKIQGVAILPKPAAKHSLMIYVFGVEQNPRTIESILQRTAELGMAAVGIKCGQTDQAAFDQQFLALRAYIQKQSWALSNATAWVGVGQGSQRTLSCAFEHPEAQPQLLVNLSGSWVPELNRFTNQFGILPLHCPVLLVESADDGESPSEDVGRLASLLATAGAGVNIQILRGESHDFGLGQGVVARAAAEYCRAHLPLTDYTDALVNCRLNDSERERFNSAMQRAGQHRPELWKAVASSREPERRTVMMLIGGFADNDLAHMSAAHLKKVVHIAWQARRRFPWCRDTPLDIFESVTADPRFYEEPIEDFQSNFSRRLYDEIKYCHTTQEASDTIWRWMHKRVLWNGGESGKGKTPMQVLDHSPTDCLGYVVLYSALCRSVGLAERPTKIVWQNSLDEHYCTEVWGVEDGQWHELDSSADNRTYKNLWILRVPKAMILAPVEGRGRWNALAESRLDGSSNTIGLVYPSGGVAIKVLNHGLPAPDQPLCVQLPTVKGPVLIASESTDAKGEAHLVLGESAKYPYRIFIDGPGESPWEWLEVHANQTHEVVLNLEDARPFNPDMPPPALARQPHSTQ